MSTTSSRSGEITVRDLVTWVPGLHVHDGDRSRTRALLENEVEWVVSARSTSPMLPTLRGGELVLLPARVAREASISFDMLLAELSTQPVAGVVTDQVLDTMVNARLPVLSASSINADLENDLNRLLTQHRNEILRTSTELERAIADHAARQSTLDTMITSIGRQFNLDVTVTDTAGDILHGTHPDIALPGSTATDQLPDCWLQSPLRSDRTLWIGPLAHERAALGRLVIRQLTSGVQRAIDQSAASAPHGRARVETLNRLLNAGPENDPEHVSALATQAGIPLRSALRVVMVSTTLDDDVMRRHLGQLGTLLDAGHLEPGHAAIIVHAVQTPPGRTGQPFLPNRSWLASSAPIASSGSLIEATRQARYVALLMEHGCIAPGVAYFEDDAQLGAYRLLFDHWGSPALQHYIDRYIGPLLRQDRRGLLQETLLAYLEHGGAQRSTSERLAIHRNTLSYRLRQIRDSLDVNPDDPTHRMGLHLALIASTLPAVPTPLPFTGTLSTL